MKIYFTAFGLALSIFGIVVRSNATHIAAMVGALGFFATVLLDYWHRDSQRTRRRAERLLLAKMVAALHETGSPIKSNRSTDPNGSNLVAGTGERA